MCETWHLQVGIAKNTLQPEAAWGPMENSAYPTNQAPEGLENLQESRLAVSPRSPSADNVTPTYSLRRFLSTSSYSAKVFSA